MGYALSKDGETYNSAYGSNRGGAGSYGYGSSYPNQTQYDTSAYQPWARTHTGPAYDLIQTEAPSVRTRQDWLIANANARVASQPWYGPYSQLDSPMVQSHLDPHALHQNPLDPYLDNIFYTVSTYRGRNTNFDLRGQPELPPGWNEGTDQLIHPHVVERLHYHGSGHQIEACKAAKPPRY